ncbi:MAG TPA: hypothetical protein GX513_05735, partial [Firmicutes bacterium]|nr:hypothetical protein [Bacillota bacterium]
MPDVRPAVQTRRPGTGGRGGIGKVIKITGATPPEIIRDILIASVGGQGGILTARILADGFRRQGWQVKTSEVHGMAQRGGSVET